MLIVLAHNTTGGDVSSYDVEVRINERVIWSGTVDEHTRAHGWPALLRQIAAVADAAPRSEPGSGDEVNILPVRSHSVIRREAVQQPDKLAQEVIARRAGPRTE